MANGSKNASALEQLKAFLWDIFQFESEDLDFGIYKILNYKRAEIKNFINKLLVEKVKEQLTIISDRELLDLQEKVAEQEKDETIIGYLTAQKENPQEAEILYKYNKKKIDEYLLSRKLLENARQLNRTEEIVYNHLALFFSRYYDKGDFISKRRFGKSEKYVVPYNGEETFFYWANYDQYYIKSSEHFQHYAFKASQFTSSLTVHFKLTQAQTEQGNVKESEKRFFVLSPKEPELTKNELTIYFEYRPLTPDEKKEFGNQRQQEKLNEKAAGIIRQKLGKKAETKELWEEKDGKSLLLRKLNHYTKKNTYDFFIHKDLKGFLQRELDYYIKSELVNVDDLYVLESEEHYERVRHNFKLIKVFKNIADTIIDFLAQIENFQKKLWEKKKFVISTEWVITIDKLAAWLDEEDFEKIVTEALKNEKQIAEWQKLFGEEIFDKWENIGIEDLKVKNGGQAEISFAENKQEWKKLPIDTVHFPNDFKTALLTELSEKINLEEEADGLVIHSDNFHGLTLLQEKFYEMVKCIYIDPPYNSPSSEIVYKNNYKHSSWLSLIENRLSLGKNLLNLYGSNIVAIDENEINQLYSLIPRIFGGYDNTIISIEHNKKGIQGDHFSFSNDFAIFSVPYTLKELNKIDLPRNAWEYSNFRNWGGESLRSNAKNCFYPIYIKDGKIMAFGEICDDDFHPESSNISKEEIIAVYPIDNNGIERKWRYARDTVETIVDKLKVEKDRDGKYQIKIAKVDFQFKTIWYGSKYNAGDYGTKILTNLGFNKGFFDFPKSIYTVRDSIFAVSDDNELILDYFAGSGTTWHATQILNKEDGGKRKCILIEQGNYVYTVIIPRIKKIAYTFDWKDGKPKNGSMNGLGVFFKYQRLEQYEEALENIALSADEKALQQALQFDQYLPKYFLAFESRGSQTLVNVEAMQNPWDYKLKIWNGFNYDEKVAVDLVETFNYLIGLHAHKIIVKENLGQQYFFVSGKNNDERKILVVWRNVKGWGKEDFVKDADFLKKELEKFDHEMLYLNGQSLLEGAQLIEEVFKRKMIAG